MYKHTKTIAVYSIILALTILFGWIPYVLFMVPLIFSAVNFDFKTSLFAGAAFGIVSFLFSLMGGSVVALAFVTAPWIPIVARILVGAITFGSYRLFLRLWNNKPRLKKYMSLHLASAIGSISNTVLIVAPLYLFMSDLALGETTIKMLIPMFLLFGLIEAITYATVIPVLSLQVRRAINKSKDKEYFGLNLIPNIPFENKHSNTARGENQ